jgi:hypothetical protein
MREQHQWTRATSENKSTMQSKYGSFLFLLAAIEKYDRIQLNMTLAWMMKIDIERDACQRLVPMKGIWPWGARRTIDVLLNHGQLSPTDDSNIMNCIE